MWRLVVVAVAAAALSAPAAAVARPRATLTVSTRAVRADLRVTTAAKQAGAMELRIRGVVIARSGGVRLALLRCADAACAARGLAVLHARRVPRGRSSMDVTWRTRAARVRFRLRHGDRTLATAVLRLRRAAPVVAPQPVGGASGGPPRPPAPASAPPEPPLPLTLTTAPALQPAYDPSIPDFTVRCDAGTPVHVTAHVPAGRTLSVDGAAAASGAIERDVSLQPGQSFAIDDADDGRVGHHVVRCAPPDLPAWTVARDGTPQAAFIAFAPSLNGGAPYAVIADDHGVPVWWIKSPEHGPGDFKVLPDGTVAFAAWNGAGRGEIVRYALDGTLLSTWTVPGQTGADPHDFEVLPNGLVVLLTRVARDHVDLTDLDGPTDATVIDFEFRAIRPDGGVAWTWSTKDHVAIAETRAWGRAKDIATPWTGGTTAYDIVHVNSFEPDGDGFVFSSRHTDAVYRVRSSDGAIDWKLGGRTTPRSLRFVGDPYGNFSGQHDARVLPDGTLTLQDNGTVPRRAPRAVRYAIDRTTRTATLVEQVVDPRASNAYCCGGARRLPGGDWVASWGANSLVTELRPDGQPVLTLALPDGAFSYRAIPAPDGVLTRAALEAGMDAQHPR